MDTLDKLNEIYNTYKSHFKNDVLGLSFHNALWQIMINDVHGEKERCLTATLDDDGMILALVCKDENGYYPLANFKDGDYDNCVDKAHEISKEIFDHDEDKITRIVFNSMSLTS